MMAVSYCVPNQKQIRVDIGNISQTKCQLLFLFATGTVLISILNNTMNSRSTKINEADRMMMV